MCRQDRDGSSNLESVARRGFQVDMPQQPPQFPQRPPLDRPHATSAQPHYPRNLILRHQRIPTRLPPQLATRSPVRLALRPRLSLPPPRQLQRLISIAQAGRASDLTAVRAGVDRDPSGASWW